MELHQCINFLLTTAQHSVFQYLNSKLSPYDITPAQYSVLSCLWGKDYATPKQIAESVGLETSTISGVLDRMQKKGLIDRVVDTDDRRAIQVIITKSGQDLQKPIQEIIEQVNRDVLKDFSKDEVSQLKSALQHISNTDFSKS